MKCVVEPSVDNYRSLIYSPQVYEVLTECLSFRNMKIMMRRDDRTVTGHDLSRSVFPKSQVVNHAYSFPEDRREGMTLGDSRLHSELIGFFLCVHKI